MRTLRFLLVVLLFPYTVVAQNGWRELNVPQGNRYDDVFFLNDTVGWAIESRGNIYITKDGGSNWNVQINIGKHLRSIEFSSPSTGFCGSLDSGFYKTTNGGVTWTDIRDQITPRIPGICGLSAPDSLNIYGCGAWYSPAYVIRSRDGGVTWTRKDMSAYSRGLVDILFIDKDHGFACGRGAAAVDGGVILYTDDGGETWRIVAKTDIRNDYIWKLQTPDRKHFFASVQGAPGSYVRFMKSIDAGINWQIKVIQPYYKYIQMIGFLDPLNGWTGGDGELYMTKDGGVNWTDNISFGFAYNRFFRINSKLAYMTGQKVYKYNAQQDAGSTTTEPDEVHSLKVYPNPSEGMIRIETVFANSTFARLELFTADGSVIRDIFNGRVNNDSRTFEVDLQNHPAAVYFVCLRTNEGVISRKLIKK